MSRLLNLPSELLARTCSYVNHSSLKSLRQSCRFTSQLATDQLYRTVHLKPSETSQNALQGILNNPSLRRLPRKIYIDTVDENIVRLSQSTSKQQLIRTELRRGGRARMAPRLGRSCSASQRIASAECRRSVLRPGVYFRQHGF
jgi:hypothetical protein